MGSNRFFPFSTVVFASWDFHLTDPSAARNLRRSIRNQLKEMVNDALLADKIISRKTKIKEFARKVRTCGVLPVTDTRCLGWQVQSPVMGCSVSGVSCSCTEQASGVPCYFLALQGSSGYPVSALPLLLVCSSGCSRPSYQQASYHLARWQAAWL